LFGNGQVEKEVSGLQIVAKWCVSLDLECPGYPHRKDCSCLRASTDGFHPYKNKHAQLLHFPSFFFILFFDCERRLKTEQKTPAKTEHIPAGEN
jgi:hypothetical protein